MGQEPLEADRLPVPHGPDEPLLALHRDAAGRAGPGVVGQNDYPAVAGVDVFLDPKRVVLVGLADGAECSSAAADSRFDRVARVDVFDVFGDEVTRRVLTIPGVVDPLD